MPEHKKLSFKKLPIDVQKKLIILNRRGEDRFVFSSRPSIFIWLAIALPLIWIAYVLAATQDTLWEDWMLWLYASLTVVAVIVLVFGLLKVFSAYAAKFKNGHIFTPNEFIKIKDNCVQSWPLTEVEAVTFTEEEKCLEVGLPGQDEKFRVWNSYEVKRLGENFNDWKQNASGNFLEAYEKPEFAHSGGGKTAVYAAAVIAAVVLGAGLGYAAKGMNRNFDDEATWKKSSKEGTIKAFDEYKLRHPSGKYISNADEKIAGVLKALKDEYTAKTTKHSDPQAVTAFGSLLESILKDPHLKIYLRIREQRELDEAMVDKAEKFSGNNVYSYEQALPVSAADTRRNLVFEKFKHSFSQQLKNVDINFEDTQKPPEGAPLIDVVYTLKSHESVYNFRSYNSYEVHYYPGVVFKFDFSLKPGGGANPYQVKFDNSPDNFNTGLFKQEDSGNYSFDKVLFGAATDNFRNYVEAKFGFIDITNT